MGEGAGISIWYEETGWQPLVDAEGIIWLSDETDNPPFAITAAELHWTDHQYKSVAGALRSLNLTA